MSDSTNNIRNFSPRVTLAPELANKLKEQYDPRSHAVIYNLSGHPLPHTFKEWIAKNGCRTYSVFSVAVHFEDELDSWEQAIQVIDELASINDKFLDIPALEVRGKKFLFCPVKGTAAILLYAALSQIHGLAPNLAVVSFDDQAQDFVIKQVLDMVRFNNMARSSLRRRYLLKSSAGLISPVQSTEKPSPNLSSARPLLKRDNLIKLNKEQEDNAV